MIARQNCRKSQGLVELMEQRTLFSAHGVAAPPAALATGESAVFGTTDGHKGVSLTLTDSASPAVVVRFALQGDGVGRVLKTETGFDVTIDDSGETSKVSILSAGGAAVLSNVTIHGPLKSFRAETLTLTGTLAAGGSVKNILLGDVSASILRLEGVATPTRLSMASVSETSISSAGTIGAIFADSWTDVDDIRDGIVAPSIGTVKIAGDMGADLTLTDAAAELSIRKLQVGGSLISSTIRAASDMQKVICAALRDTLLLVGVNSDVEGRVSLAEQFQTDARIGSFSATGAADGVTLERSSVAATEIGRVRIGALATPKPGMLTLPFGITATKIDDYRRSETADGLTVRLKDLDKIGLADSDQRYRLEIV